MAGGCSVTSWCDSGGRPIHTGGSSSVARPTLEKLRDSAGESASLAVPRGRADMDIVLQLDPARHVGVANWVGTDVPLHASSAGKLVLAELAADELEARLGGEPFRSFTERTITDVQTLTIELSTDSPSGLGRDRRRARGRPRRDLRSGSLSSGTLAAIVGISGPAFRLTKTRRRGVLTAVMATAAEIERRLLEDAGAHELHDRLEIRR